jgi:amidohydrolase
MLSIRSIFPEASSQGLPCSVRMIGLAGQLVVMLGVSTCPLRSCEGQSPASWTEPEVVAMTASTIADYETIHQTPELGKEEIRTASFILQRLHAVGYTKFIAEPTLPTAVIAVLDSGNPGPTIVLRAELDARPQQEKAAVSYASKVPGKMHSCGHDAHAAMLLNAASILFRHRMDLHGKLVLLFQPAEETPGGADDIVRDGILTALQADYIFAQHVAPGLPVGTIQVAPGPIMASSTYFTVNVSGAGAHAADPQESSDIVKTAASLVVDLTNFPARHLDVVARPTLISIVRFQSGDPKATNILPKDAAFGGTLRSFEDITTTGHKPDGLLTVLNVFLQSRAAAEHATVTVDWHNGSPVAVNDSQTFQLVVPVISQAWRGIFSTSDQRSMYSEDFAFYSSIVPSLYFSLGVQGHGHGIHPVHSEEFDIDLEALPQGLRLLLELAQLGSVLPSNSHTH